MLGHMILLGLKEPVYPWCSDGPSEAELGGTLETTLSRVGRRVPRAGRHGHPAALPEPERRAGGAGRDRSRRRRRDDPRTTPYNHLEYYRYLNAGYRLPLVGGTDKMSSEVAVGQYRTYVHIPPDEEFSYDSWCRNLQLGRTFLSGGPLLEFSVDGAQIGDTVQLPAGGGTVEVSATARSMLPVHTLQIVQNGQVVAADRRAGRRAHAAA